MKALIPYCCLIMVVQLWACASQSDSMTQEKKVHKDEIEKVLPKEEKKTESRDDEVIIDEKKDKNLSNSIGNSGKKMTTPAETKDNTLGDAISGENKIEALSIISYNNIIENAPPAMPIQGQKVKLMIKNNHQQAMWYLMPVSGEKTMPSNGRFYVNSEASTPFLAKQYGTSDHKLIELIYHGAIQQSFRAFYIKSGSSLLFRNYDLGTYKAGEYVPFWAIKNLEVNNEISLEEWLPFSVVSSPNVVIHNKTGAVEWQDMSKDAVFSNQKIKFIQANGIKKHQIPVGVIR